jgi:hypothetical protein
LLFSLRRGCADIGRALTWNMLPRLAAAGHMTRSRALASAMFLSNARAGWCRRSSGTSSFQRPSGGAVLYRSAIDQCEHDFDLTTTRRCQPCCEIISGQSVGQNGAGEGLPVLASAPECQCSP